MPRQVYSTPFVQYTSSTPNLSYEVPAGYTAIIRQITACQQAGAFDMGVYIQDSESAALLNIYAEPSSGTFNMLQQEGRWTVPAGGIISVTLSTILSGMSVYVGGYLLIN